MEGSKIMSSKQTNVEIILTAHAKNLANPVFGK